MTACSRLPCPAIPLSVIASSVKHVCSLGSTCSAQPACWRQTSTQILPDVAIEYVEGLTLQRHVEKFTGRFPQHLLRLLAVGLLEALVAVHGKGIVHRDLKPPTSS